MRGFHFQSMISRPLNQTVILGDRPIAFHSFEEEIINILSIGKCFLSIRVFKKAKSPFNV